MGYEVHITRKDFWCDDGGLEIGLDEWLSYVASYPEMRADGFAQASFSDGAVLRTDDPGIAVWTAWSKHEIDGGMAWFCHFEDRVSVKNPDAEILSKMHRIAQTLGATVQGDEGETYDSDGNSNWTEMQELDDPVPPGRPWWQFWR